MLRATTRRLFGGALVKQLRFLSSQQIVAPPPGDELPPRCDVLVIGGGGMGASVAYWLKCKSREHLNVVVVERDPCYTAASTVLSVGGVRQQFSLMENIQMSLFGAEFIGNCKRYLGDDVDLNFMPHGYLIMASEAGATILAQNSKLQNELGAKNELLSAKQLRERFPWIATDGIELGCLGREKEGWFDPWALLMGYKRQAREFGAKFFNGEVIDFEWNASSLSGAIVKSATGEKRTVQFDTCVMAAGAHSGQLAKLANIGTGTQGVLSVAVPVEPRKRYVYVFSTQGENCPGLATPLTIDPNGTYFRRDGLGGNFLGGRSPSEENEPDSSDLSVDHGYFESDVWPTLATRVPAFESAKVLSSWAGYYEHNTFDANGIIGRHPHYSNLLLATGFSGHGIQQTPAVGRAISELILDGKFTTINLSRFGFDRVVDQRPILEVNIV